MKSPECDTFSLASAELLFKALDLVKEQPLEQLLQQSIETCSNSHKSEDMISQNIFVREESAKLIQIDKLELNHVEDSPKTQTNLPSKQLDLPTIQIEELRSQKQSSKSEPLILESGFIHPTLTPITPQLQSTDFCSSRIASL